MLDKQIKVIFLVDGFVFENIESAKKFIDEKSEKFGLWKK